MRKPYELSQRVPRRDHFPEDVTLAFYRKKTIARSPVPHCEGTQEFLEATGAIPRHRCKTESQPPLRLRSAMKILKAIDSEAAVMDTLTWERVAQLEPRVLELLVDIRLESPNNARYLSIWRKYKTQLSTLVGWEREDPSYPALRSSAAYNLVYHMLLNNLRDPED